MKKDVKKDVKKKDVKKDVKKIDKIKDYVITNKKKLLQGAGVVLSVLIVLGLAFMVSIEANKNTNLFEFIDITIDEYLEKMQGEEKSIIYIARPGCSWCQKETPLIKSLGGENNLKIYYLNTDSFWDSEANTYTENGEKFMNSAEQYKDGWGTPNTIIVANGSIVDGEFSYADKDKLKDLFKRNGFINE